MAEQLQQVVSGADQLPLRSHTLQATKPKPPKSSNLLDLSEYRLHNHLALCVELFVWFIRQAFTHSFGFFGMRNLRRQDGVRQLWLAVRRNQHIDRTQASVAQA